MPDAVQACACPRSSRAACQGKPCTSFQVMSGSLPDITADWLLGSGPTPAEAGADSSSCGAGACQQQYLQAGLTDHSVALTDGRLSLTAGALAASGSSAEGASTEADGGLKRLAEPDGTGV